jgi:hypothetical protein
MTAAPIPVWAGASRKAGDDAEVASIRRAKKKKSPESAVAAKEGGTTRTAAKPKLSPKDLPATVNAATTGTFRPASAKTTPVAAPAKKDAEAPPAKKKTATAKPAAKPKPADKSKP